MRHQTGRSRCGLFRGFCRARPRDLFGHSAFPSGDKVSRSPGGTPSEKTTDHHQSGLPCPRLSVTDTRALIHRSRSLSHERRGPRCATSLMSLYRDIKLVAVQTVGGSKWDIYFPDTCTIPSCLPSPHTPVAPVNVCQRVSSGPAAHPDLREEVLAVAAAGAGWQRSSSPISPLNARRRGRRVAIAGRTSPCSRLLGTLPWPRSFHL